MTQSKIRFPKKFMWGASTAAHQVEGNTTNQWSVWEEENASSLAARAPYHYDDLDRWSRSREQATTPSNYVSGRAVDHFNRYEEDFDILTKLGLNSFRFSIEWSRIEPEQGRWNAEAIEHYRRYLQALEKRHITPVVTLMHFTLPTWFADLGGFEKRRNVKYFQNYVEKIITELGQHMKFIVTINEPEVYAAQSYHEGNWPPQSRSRWLTWRVLENQIAAHAQASRFIRAKSRKYQVSMAYSVSHIYAGDDALLSRWYARVFDELQNHYILRRSMRHNTYIGLNYYFSDRIYGYRVHNPNDELSDLGWDMQPSEIRYVLEDLADRYDKPILITENGVADAEDEHRQWWMSETIRAMHRARENGVNLLGYMHWSLLDNFEWDKGFWPKFGLVSVNRTTMERSIRPSARGLARVIASVTKDRT